MLSLYPQPESHQLSRSMSLITLEAFPAFHLSEAPSPSRLLRHLYWLFLYEPYCSQRTRLNQVFRLPRRIPTQGLRVD